LSKATPLGDRSPPSDTVGEEEFKLFEWRFSGDTNVGRSSRLNRNGPTALALRKSGERTKI
jgi:hypothetical protein